METRWGWGNAPRGRGGRGSRNNPPTRNVYCPRHGVTILEQSSHCCYNNTDNSVNKRSHRRRNRANQRTVSLAHLSSIVDRLGSRIDHQSLMLASRLDEITRRIDLVDLSQSEITLLLRRTPLEGQEKLVQ